VILNGSFTD